MYKYFIALTIICIIAAPTNAQVVPPSAQPQSDTTGVVVIKDARIDQLIHRQIEINEETTRDSRRSMPGFRIQVMNSTDRNKIFAAKTKIYQEYPDLKPYVLYSQPYYKLRVGNFRTQQEAEDFEKQLSQLFPSGLFVIRDTIEVSPDKLKEELQP